LLAVGPQIADRQALVLAVGIIGATVMPHAVYLHSGLTHARIPPRNEGEKRRLVRISNHEVIAALAVAGLDAAPFARCAHSTHRLTLAR
jgi:manganese transport protein